MIKLTELEKQIINELDHPLYTVDFIDMLEARAFFLLFFNADCERICVENPVPMKMAGLPPCAGCTTSIRFVL